MKIWIAGASGMLGSHFTTLLKERGLNYVGTDLVRNDIKVDITNPEEISDFISSEKCSHIINCAAYTQVDKAEIERELSFKVNVTGPKNLGRASHRFKIPVIHFSTDYVFDGNGSAPYKEDHACAPINYYGMTKWEGEQALQQETDQACIIRTSWLYGLNGKNFVETMLKLMQTKESLRIVSDQIGCPTYCQDLAEATLMLLDKTGIFHFANPHQTSWFDFAKEIYRQGLELGYPLKSVEFSPIVADEYPTAAKRPAYSTLSTTKFESILGRPVRTWENALRDYLIKHIRES